MDFSLEMTAEKIYDSRTREYFKEVFSSYQNGNYRSAIVMLYSVVVSDLVYKLLDMRDIYNDETATSILKQIEAKQTAKPASSDWETFLLKEINTQTELINGADLFHLESLRTERHLAAHPVLNQNYLLLAPTKETVRAYIRTSLETVLIKPPLLTKKSFFFFIAEVGRVYEQMSDLNKLDTYLNNRFFKNITPLIELTYFETLWGFVFHKEDAACEKNREANLMVLDILYKRQPQEILGQISERPDKFGERVNPLHIKYLAYFCYFNPEIYKKLRSSEKILIEQKSNQDYKIKALAWFTFSAMKDYTNWIKTEPAFKNVWQVEMYDTIQNIYGILINQDLTKEAIDIFTYFYEHSSSYDRSDSLWPYLQGLLSNMNKKDLTALLNAIDQNAQTYHRKKAAEDHKALKKRADEIMGKGYDYRKHFPNYGPAFSIIKYD
jgi:hypothetical protein